MKILKHLFLLCLVAASTPAFAKTVTLRCAPGYTIDVTIELHIVLTEAEREAGESSSWTRTLSCPPDLTLDIPDRVVPYDGLHADWDMTAPDGTESSGSLPPAPAPGEPPPGHYAAWGTHPLAPRSYVCNSRTCVEDPVAPTFVQPGEFVIGDFDDGDVFDLTTVVLDAQTMLPVPNATVTIYRDSDSLRVARGTTEASGRRTLGVDAGGTYFIHVEGNGYSPQRSDAFQVFRAHEWRILLTPAPAGGQQTPLGSLLSAWYPWIILLLLILLIVSALRKRR
jgi:hypothetical protein